MEKGRAFLVRLGPDMSKISKKEIKSLEFKIGRSKKADICLTDITVSRSHCVISCCDNEWWLRNESQFGTVVSDKLLALNEKCILSNGDIIKLGPESDCSFKFCAKVYNDEPPTKYFRMETAESESTNNEDSDSTAIANFIDEEMKLKKQNEDLNSQLKQIMQEKEEVKLRYEEEKQRIENELISEKQALEQRLKEMENLLTSKEKEQEHLNKKLRETDEENMKLIASRQEANLKAEAMVAALKKEVMEKELEMREILETEMKNLLNTRTELEKNIMAEKAQTEGACAEKLKALNEELSRVKQDLLNAEGKKCLLEKELEEAENKIEKGPRNSLSAKRDVLSEFADMVELELQCSICSELFVKAITLNCSHTTCHYCLQEWKKKKNECPLCRTPILTENHSIVLDNFIDKIVDNLSKEMKKRRLEIVEERKALEILSEKGPKRKGKKKRQTYTAVRMRAEPSSSRDLPEIISVEEENDHNYDVRESGRQNQSHHRRGACFNCGEYGHWAYSCPYRN